MSTVLGRSIQTLADHLAQRVLAAEFISYYAQSLDEGAASFDKGCTRSNSTVGTKAELKFPD